MTEILQDYRKDIVNCSLADYEGHIHELLDYFSDPRAYEVLMQPAILALLIVRYVSGTNATDR